METRKCPGCGSEPLQLIKYQTVFPLEAACSRCLLPAEKIPEVMKMYIPKPSLPVFSKAFFDYLEIENDENKRKSEESFRNFIKLPNRKKKLKG